MEIPDTQTNILLASLCRKLSDHSLNNRTEIHIFRVKSMVVLNLKDFHSNSTILVCFQCPPEGSYT